MLLLLIVVKLKKLWRYDIILCHSVHSKFRGKEPDYSRFERGTHRQYSVTGILGSNPDTDGRFRFKPWTGSWRKIPWL